MAIQTKKFKNKKLKKMGKKIVKRTHKGWNWVTSSQAFTWVPLTTVTTACNHPGWLPHGRIACLPVILKTKETVYTLHKTKPTKRVYKPFNGGPCIQRSNYLKTEVNFFYYLSIIMYHFLLIQFYIIKLIIKNF